ncbi:hypothetical protein GJ496_005543 [Pomphorhynchus laevis]|nr:hypothetical protein GJ496_005543 [Pomphorhynchus laevis]
MCYKNLVTFTSYRKINNRLMRSHNSTTEWLALENLPNLIRRTQLKRFKTADIAVERQIADEERNNGDDSKHGGDDLTRREQYNEEIFDDNDFFYALFERSVHKTGLGIMSSAYHKDKINKKKTKKKHHPSKGRMIRYNVHPKLANFYCPTLVTNDEKPINDGNLSFDREALLEAIRNG